MRGDGTLCTLRGSPGCGLLVAGQPECGGFVVLLAARKTNRILHFHFTLK
jgi:hypothetical protein